MILFPLVASTDADSRVFARCRCALWHILLKSMAPNHIGSVHRYLGILAVILEGGGLD